MAHDEDRIRRIIADFRQALRDNRAPTVDEVLAQHPDLADRLRHPLSATASELAGAPDAGDSAVASDITVDFDPSSDTPRSGSPVRVRSGSSDASGAATASGQEILAGDTVGDYRVLRLLGRGGMGEVYEAEHIVSGRRVALKLLSPKLPRTPVTIQRFLNEASLAAVLNHPRTTFIYEAGERDGHFFISMELMPGRTLKDVVRSEGQQPVNRAVDHILDVLEGLEAAHKVGVVHRDVKPSNCFVDDDGRVKVGDFGLSKSLVAESDLTQSGTFLGTPQFAAPEQFRRGTVDNRTDLFAVGATLYYLIAGEAPFVGDPASVIAQIVADDPAPLHNRRADVPKSLGNIVARALAKDPKRRFRDAAELRQVLLPYSSDGSSIADIGRRVAAFFVDVFLLSIVSYLATWFYSGYSAYGAAFEPLSVVLSSLIWIPYFAIAEGLYSHTLGKYWLGLRVVDMYGEAPGILRAALRAIILPGLTWLSIEFVLQWYNRANFQVELGQMPSFTIWNIVIVPQLLALARIGLCLLACSSMRGRNGYRGWHEILSGTRIVRPIGAEEAATRTAVIPRVAPIVADTMPSAIGPFEIRGMLGTVRATTVFVATDTQLDRTVWIYLFPEDTGTSAARLQVFRPTRQHWLQTGNEDGQSWEAMEVVNGAPLPRVIQWDSMPWSVARHVWLDVAEELNASLGDETLPDTFDLEQVWVDQRGHAKLLDHPLLRGLDEKASIAEASATDVASPAERETERTVEQKAFRLLREVGAACTIDEQTPAAALDFSDALASGRHAPQTISSVVDRLREVVASPFRLRWDDRLGILAISAGLESVLYSPLALAVGMLLSRLTSSSVTWRMAVAGTAGLIVPAVIGYFMRGGPAFWLNKVDVRTNARKRASRWRCTARNVIAWFPIVFAQGTLGLWLGFLGKSAGGGFDQPVSLEMGLSWATVGVYALISVIVQIVGFSCALIQPRRGLQDLLAGTYLVRR